MKRVTARGLRSWGAFVGLSLAIAGGQSYADDFELIGINVAGAEFTSKELPGKHGTHYFFPDEGYFKYWQDKGIRNVRFPVKWERLQPSLNGELDETYAELIDSMLDDAARHDMDIILDVHNYARYRGDVIGSEAVPFGAYEDLMARIAKRWHNHSALYAYDIMNEPYGDAEDNWPEAAQAGIDGIRAHDRKRPLYIEGNSWSSAARWQKYAEPLLDLKDPADNIVFSAHLYIDHDASGRYKEKPTKNFDTSVGVKRAEPFIEWLQEHGKRGHIGEFGIPDDHPKWNEAAEELLSYLQQHCIPVSYWAAGPSWGKYRLSIEPKDGKDRPQMAVLEKFIGEGGCKGYGPVKQDS
ncbi:endoglucanase [Halopseudomonas xinjiangensis]|uniref:Endoglucanase n=1 Tax=Halopseudomonas xinjiangensis TaxID=487184 RepID=A0A1H1WG15_9GAMM|nr:glycoside hydrolase family 5 protein [Halopseudomonas xinjiangensis]SDS95600.1 endoglucanase [Halopseudomonas xinjiangensis]